MAVIALQYGPVKLVSHLCRGLLSVPSFHHRSAAANACAAAKRAALRFAAMRRPQLHVTPAHTLATVNYTTKTTAECSFRTRSVLSPPYVVP